MKKIIAILCAAVAIAASSIDAEAAKPKAKSETVVFTTNMHCEKCVKKVNENIAFEKGVKALDVNLEKQTIKVTYDASKTSKENLAAAIKKLGYKADVCKPEEVKK